jgi:fatty-acyl-CoA synthase
LSPDDEWAGDGVIESAKFPELRRVIVKAADGTAKFPGTLDWATLDRGGGASARSELAARVGRVSPDDTLFIMFTSGTTGFPKGVMRHHGFLRNQFDRIAGLATTEKDLMFNYLPLFHVFGYVDGPLCSVLAGNRQILAETFDPDDCLDTVEREGVTQICGFESHLTALIEAQEKRARNLSSLRTGLFAAGMQSAVPVMRKALKVLSPLRPVTAYGMTELGANVCVSQVDDSDDQICESSGRPCDGFDIRIVDPESGNDQPTGVPGEILVKTYNVMQGYYRKPEETAAAIDSDGWFHTGDSGYMREDGYLRFLGRYKDMLKIGGENVDPVEVEGSLLSHPNVQSAAVVGLPDKRLTEVAVAFIVPKTGREISTVEIQSFCKGRIASFKIPKHVIAVKELPMTSTGKVRKVELREQAVRLFAGNGAS